MRHHAALPLVACFHILGAAELPVVSQTIFPDGAERVLRGTLPAGDSQVSGLPTDLDPDRLTVAVAGMAAPRWRLRITPPTTVEDPQAAKRRDLETRLETARSEQQRAAQRRELAGLVNTPGEPPTDPTRPPPALPTPSDVQALGRFVASNTRTALNDSTSAEQRCAALEQELAQMPGTPPQQSRAYLELPGADGHEVTVTLRVRGVRWAPRYRLEVTGSDAVLVLAAALDDQRGDDPGTIPTVLSSERSSAGLLLAGMPIPVLGMAETVADLATPREGAFMAIGAGGGEAGMFGSRAGGGRKRAVGKGGGSKGSESSVEANLRSFRQRQRSDGSLGNPPWTGQSTALAALSLLGAGYDHKTPNKYRQTVAGMLGWLRTRVQQPLNLVELAQATTVLAEAYAMTADSELREPLETVARDLARRAPSELPTLLKTDGAFSGSESLGWLLFAARAIRSGGLDDQGLYTLCVNTLPVLDHRLDGDEAWAVRLCCRVMTSQPVQIAAEELDRMISRIPSLYAAGRPEVLHFATLGLFQLGGTAWKRWNATMRDYLVQQQVRGGDDDGMWRSPHPAGTVAGTALCSLTLEVYYRYAQIRQKTAGGDDEEPAPQPEALGSLQSRGWPLRWPLAQRPAGMGRTTVDLQRIALDGAVHWQAIPVQDPAVWRTLVTINPLPGALPEADCRLVLDGVARGTTRIPFTLPGDELRVPLGQDQRLRVERSPGTSSEDGWRRRELEVTLTYRLYAPAGWKQPVDLIEPLPRVASDDLRFTPLDPAWNAATTAKRIADDPFWRLSLGSALNGAPPATATATAPATATAALRYRLAWPKDQTPVLEFAP